MASSSVSTAIRNCNAILRARPLRDLVVTMAVAVGDHRVRGRARARDWFAGRCAGYQREEDSADQQGLISVLSNSASVQSEWVRASKPSAQRRVVVYAGIHKVKTPDSAIDRGPTSSSPRRALA